MCTRPSRTLLALTCALALAASAGAQSFAANSSSSLPDAPSALQVAAAPAPQQGSATLSGVVSDITGGLVPNASIKLQDKAHATLHETTTDASGSFSFTALAPGTYTVLISAKGLETFLSQPVTLKANAHVELPDVALPIAAANTSVDVASNSAAVADEELKIETEQRVFAVFPNYYTSFVYNAAPLNTKQKFRLSLHATLDPVAFIAPAIVAGIQQANDTFPGWSTDTAGYFKRYFADYGDAFIGRNIGSGLFPVIFHQDPRYFYMGPSHPLKQRVWHAISAGIIVRGDNGHLQPNYSHIAGNASAGALSSVYHPASNSAQSLALDNALIGIGGTAVQGLIREFLWSHFTTHVPAYAKGKPPAPPATAAPAPASAPSTTAPVVTPNTPPPNNPS
jgi:hypothetical protein